MPVVAPAPPPPAPVYTRRDGHYETRQVQQWVEGRTERVYVQPVCERYGRRGKKMRCTDGGYQTRFVPGHYVMVEQQVWVEHLPSRPNPPRPMFGAVSINVGF